MVFLDQDGIEQTDAVIVPTAAADGVFLCEPKPGYRFPGVEYPAGCARHGSYVIRGYGRGRRQQLQKVKCRSLRSKYRTGRAGHIQ